MCLGFIGFDSFFHETGLDRSTSQWREAAEIPIFFMTIILIQSNWQQLSSNDRGQPFKLTLYKNMNNKSERTEVLNFSWINRALQDLAGNYERKIIHYSILVRIFKATVVFKDQHKNKLKWEIEHHHCHPFSSPSILESSSKARLCDLSPLADLTTALPTCIFSVSDLGMPKGRQEINMAIIFRVPVVICSYTEKPRDFTSGRVFGLSSFFWVVFHFQPTSH